MGHRAWLCWTSAFLLGSLELRHVRGCLCEQTLRKTMVTECLIWVPSRNITHVLHFQCLGKICAECGPSWEGGICGKQSLLTSERASTWTLSMHRETCIWNPQVSVCILPLWFSCVSLLCCMLHLSHEYNYVVCQETSCAFWYVRAFCILLLCGRLCARWSEGILLTTVFYEVGQCHYHWEVKSVEASWGWVTCRS